jgi:hypothetical protein
MQLDSVAAQNLGGRKDVFLMPVTSDGDDVRVLDKEKMIHAQAALAFFGNAVLDGQGFGVTHAAEIANDAGAGHR